MTIRIVTDSTCDIPAELVRANNITVIPMYINVGSEAFRDGIFLFFQLAILCSYGVKIALGTI